MSGGLGLGCRGRGLGPRVSGVEGLGLKGIGERFTAEVCGVEVKTSREGQELQGRGFQGWRVKCLGASFLQASIQRFSLGWGFCRFRACC